VAGGFVVIRTVDTNGFIPFLGVIPSRRGMGIGTGLAKFALSRLRDRGAYKIALYNVNEDPQTVRMLDKLDFRITMKQIEMRKRLVK
jgi:ribosomal protein S18 acetylase RimI-like enzyme